MEVTDRMRIPLFLPFRQKRVEDYVVTLDDAKKLVASPVDAVPCARCRHLVDRKDAVKIAVWFVGLHIEAQQQDEYYCPDHKPFYDQKRVTSHSTEYRRWMTTDAEGIPVGYARVALPGQWSDADRAAWLQRRFDHVAEELRQATNTIDELRRSQKERRTGKRGAR